MVTEATKIDVKPVLITKEQIDYDEAIKNMKYVSAKLRISQEGIDTKNVSQEELETVTKLFDEMEMIQRNFNILAQKIQQDFNNKMREFQEDTSRRLTHVNGRYRGLITSMKSDTTERKTEDCTQNNTQGEMSKEKEDEIKRSLAEELKRSQIE